MFLRSTLLIILTALIVIPIGPALVQADEAKDEVKAFHEKMKEADEAGKVKLIEALASGENPNRRKAVEKYLTNRSTAVKVAAIKGIGTIKDPKSVGRLMGMCKMAEKEPKLLAAIMTALGEFGSKKTQKTLMDTARKWLSKDSEVASAAARSLGSIQDKKAIEDLIKLLAMTYPRAPSGGATISAQTQALLKASRPGIIEGLQVLTGWDFEDAEAWNNFWEYEQKRWKPGAKDVDITALKKWVDPGYGFVMSKPSDKWVFDRTEKYKAYRIYMARLSEGVTEGYAYVQAYKNAAGLTPEQKANEFEDSYRESWKDIKPGSIKHEDIRIGKAKGFKHSFTGLDTYGSVAKVTNFFLVHNEMMFVIGSWRRTGLEDLEDEVMEALGSFKFLYK